MLFGIDFKVLKFYILLMAKKTKKVTKKSLVKFTQANSHLPPRAAREVAVKEKFSPLKKTKIKVIGIGGGGGNIVSELSQRVKKASFLAANTDLQALKQISNKVERFSFGQGFTRGLGTGMNPEIAETVSQNEKERIKKILEGQDLVIFIACLGGGTGSGATPVFTKISQSLGNLSYGIFTLPFEFEGERKMEIAKRALEILKPKLNAITIIPNERIFQIIEKTTPLKEAFSAINKNLAQSLEGLIETIYQPGLINIDFSDLRTILTESRGRLAYLNTFSFPRAGKAKEGLVKEAVEKALASPLYPYGIKGAKGVLFNIVGEKELSLEEVGQISQTISEKINPEAKIIFGISPAGKYGDITKTTIFATGCVITPHQNFWWTGNRTKTTSKPKEKKEISKDKEAKSLEKPLEGVNSKTEAKDKPLEKVKIKVVKKPEKKPKDLPEAHPQKNLGGEQANQDRKEKPATTLKEKLKFKFRKNALQLKKESHQSIVPHQEKPRKNALQIKKEIEEEEKKMLEKEKFWETPAFLRQKKIL